MLKLYLLGELRLTYRNHPYTFKALPRAHHLLAYLLLHCHQPVNRRQLAYTLFSDLPEDKMLGVLRRHIYDVRRALPKDEDWLLVNAGTIQWNPNAPYWLDIAEFDHLSTLPNHRPLPPTCTKTTYCPICMKIG